MVKKKTVKKSDKELMNGLTSEEHLTMSQKGLSDTTTAINVDTVKASKEELVEQMKADTIIPSEVFTDEEQAAEDASGTNSTDSGTIESSALESFGEMEKPMTHEELVQEYKVLQEVSYQMIEKQYALEWKVFGEEYKGKYRYLQIDKGMFIFGTNQHDLEYLPANSTKEAYAKYIDKDS